MYVQLRKSVTSHHFAILSHLTNNKQKLLCFHFVDWVLWKGLWGQPVKGIRKTGKWAEEEWVETQALWQPWLISQEAWELQWLIRVGPRGPGPCSPTSVPHWLWASEGKAKGNTPHGIYHNPLCSKNSSWLPESSQLVQEKYKQISKCGLDDVGEVASSSQKKKQWQ